jgi:hypothetical protein
MLRVFVSVYGEGVAVGNRIVRRIVSTAAAVCLASALSSALSSALAAAPAVAQTAVTGELENVATGTCLTGTDNSVPLAGYTVALQPCTAGSQQEWVISYNPGFAFVTIVDNATGDCLGVFASGQNAPTLETCGDVYDDSWIYASDGTKADSYEDIEALKCLNGATSTGVTFQGCTSADTNEAWSIVSSS